MNTQLAMVRPYGAGSAALADPALPAASFTLPTPPSVNELYKNLPGKGRVKAGLYDDFVRRGVASIRLQKVPSIAGRIVAVFAVERMSSTADIDNRLKSMLDTIVAAQVIEDDRFVTAVLATWAPKANGLAHVHLYQADRPLTFTFHPSLDGASGGLFAAPQPNGEEDGYQPL